MTSTSDEINKELSNNLDTKTAELSLNDTHKVTEKDKLETDIAENNDTAPVSSNNDETPALSKEQTSKPDMSTTDSSETTTDNVTPDKNTTTTIENGTETENNAAPTDTTAAKANQVAETPTIITASEVTAIEESPVTVTGETTTQDEIPLSLPDALEQCAKDEYLVKTIDWKNKKVRIITQNENGPCPLVAISNVLFLRGDLEIEPPDREVVTFEYLVDRLADYLLTHAPSDENNTDQQVERRQPKRQGTSEIVLTYRHNLDSALSILPNLKTGLDVNVKFDNIHGFEPTAELAMFDIFNVDLVHGWIVDPQDTETYQVIVNTFGTYNKTVESIVQMDTTNQQALTPSEEEKLHQGFLATEFLRDTATQLTYYGLDLLLDSIPKDTLCVLFRNNHFSTLYRHPKMGLYMLVTDSGLSKERDIAWESLGDVDQSTSEFLNGMFNKSSPIQENDHLIQDEDRDLDLAIAMSLQEEESTRHLRQQEQQQQQSTIQQPQAGSPRRNTPKSPKRKNDNGCIIQ